MYRIHREKEKRKKIAGRGAGDGGLGWAGLLSTEYLCSSATMEGPSMYWEDIKATFSSLSGILVMEVISDWGRV